MYLSLPSLFVKAYGVISCVEVDGSLPIGLYLPTWVPLVTLLAWGLLLDDEASLSLALAFGCLLLIRTECLLSLGCVCTLTAWLLPN